MEDNNFKLNNKSTIIYKHFFNYIFKDVIDNYTYISIKKSYDLLDQFVYDIIITKNIINKASNKQIHMFTKIYIYYISIYNTSIIEYFNKDFIKWLLQNENIGIIYYDVITFYNTKFKDIVVDKLKLPKHIIKKLIQYNQSNI